MKFAKMHGLGNNYIYFNCFDERISLEQMPEIARYVADKNFGIGSDGAIFICPSDYADAEMRIYNADGSYAQMCGNGIRCVAKYMYDMCLVDKTELFIMSGGEMKQLSLYVGVEEPNPVTGTVFTKRTDGTCVKSVKVDMGAPIFEMSKVPVSIPDDELVECNHVPGMNGEHGLTDIEQADGSVEKGLKQHPITVDGVKYHTTCISMGNPHSVIFVKDVKGLDLVKMGPSFENHPYFPERTNTEFVRVIDRNNVEMRVYERGSAETFACGTGATATAVAAIVNGYTDNEVTVHLLGGDLLIKWDEKTNHAFMTGPAEFICEGEL